MYDRRRLAVAATFLVAGVGKEMVGSEQGEVYAVYAFLCLLLEDGKSNNIADTGTNIAKKSQGEA